MEIYDSDKLPVTKSFVATLEPPVDLYERMIWCENLQKELRRIVLELDTEIYNCRSTIISDKIDSETYELVPVFSERNETRVDWDLLEEELPDVYEKSLSLTPTAAGQLLGVDKLKDICIKEVGIDRVKRASNPTIGLLRKALAKSEQPRYITSVKPQTGYDIVMKPKELPTTEDTTLE